MQEPYDKNELTRFAAAVTRPDADVESVRQFVEHGTDVNAVVSLDRDDKSISVLGLAAKHASAEVIRYLVESGADVSYVDPNGYSVLLCAVFRRFAERHDAPSDYLEYLVAAGAPLDAESKYGETLVSVCSNRGRFKLLKFFLDAGADPRPLEWTPLFHAVAYGSLTNVVMALEEGESVSAIDHWERTPFLLSVHAGRPNVAELLLARGSDCGAKGRCGMTALAYTLDRDDAEMLAWLVERGCDVEGVDEFGEHPLSLAVRVGAINCVRALLRAGASVERRDVSGDSVIKSADSAKMVEVLYVAGLCLSNVSPDLRGLVVGTTVAPETEVSARDYQAHKHRTFGRRNPERMNNPFWDEMVRSRAGAYWAASKHGDTSCVRQAVWCFNRFGHSLTRLPDGRHVEIGGEHEDYYDPDFCIYNDVVIHRGDGTFDVFGYPEDVFPPTDFHSATYIAPYIYIVGCLGYSDRRHAGVTPIYRIHCETWKIEPVKAINEAPGWIHGHEAKLIDGACIKITGGKIDLCDSSELLSNERTWVLDTVEHVWRNA
jgi:ankyrin repeat protein